MPRPDFPLWPPCSNISRVIIRLLCGARKIPRPGSAREGREDGAAPGGKVGGISNGEERRQRGEFRGREEQIKTNGCLFAFMKKEEFQISLSVHSVIEI